MTAADLISALAAEIKAVTANLKLPVEYQDENERQEISTWQKVNVFEQYIPKDLFQETTYYPCVVVEWLETRDKLRGTEIQSLSTVGLSFGVFAKEADGWKDCLHFMEVVRQRLLSVRTIANKFRLTDEMTWQTADNQPEPFFFGYAELVYQIMQPQEPFPLEQTLTPDLITTTPAKILKPDAFKRRIK